MLSLPLRHDHSLLRLAGTTALLLLAVALGAGAGRQRPAYAATFTVQTTQDAQQADGVPRGSCTSTLPQGLCTLRAAVTAANQLGGGPHTITLPAGVYDVSLGGSAQLNIGVDVNLVGSCCDSNGDPTSIIDGLNASGAPTLMATCTGGCGRPNLQLAISGVMLRNAGSAGLQLAGGGAVTLTDVGIVGNGTVGGYPGLLDQGAAITATNLKVSGNAHGGIGLVSDSSLTGTNVTVTNNTAPGESSVGGIYTYTSRLTLTDSLVDGNTASGGCAGGIQSFGGLSLTNVTISNNTLDTARCYYQGAAGLYSSQSAKYTSASLDTVTVAGNTVTGTLRDFDTGGIFATGDGSFMLTNSLVDSNSGDAGGVTLFGGYSTGAATISNTAVTNNSGVSRPGGIAWQQGPGLTLRDSWIDGNSTVSGSAAGLSVVNSAPLTATGVTISNNSGRGFSAVTPSFQMTNVTVSGNNGGLDINDYYAWQGQPQRLTNLTIAFNGAPGGLSLSGGGTSGLRLANTILSNNTGANCTAPLPAPVSQGSNLDGGSSCGFSRPDDRSNADPLLAPLADNGGATLTHALQPGSPAIDGVASGGCPPPATDQRGVSRPQGPLCDIGAFELEQGAPAVAALRQPGVAAGPSPKPGAPTLAAPRQAGVAAGPHLKPGATPRPHPTPRGRRPRPLPHAPAPQR